MTGPFTVDALTRILHLYYPLGLWPTDPAYDASEEAQRLTQLLETAQKDGQQWKGFVQKAREEFAGCMLWDLTLLWSEPCYRLRVYLPGITRGGERHDAVVCLLSLLAPVYALYASHSLDTGPLVETWTRYPPLPPEFQPHEAKLAGLIEASFGATRLLNEVLFTPIARLAPRTGTAAPDEALLVDLLLTHDRW
jgi:hypothetical protein